VNAAVRALGALCAALAVIPATDAVAQNTRIDLSGFPLQVTSTTGADFEAGSVALGSTGFTVDARTSNGPFTTRTTTVSVYCGAANCPQAGTLQETSLQWRRADLAVWNTLTTAPVTVETRNITFNGVNDPWGNTLVWRYLLNWTTNPATAMTRWRIRFQLTTTAP